MSADDELKQLADRIAKAFDDLERSQEQLAGELARRCEQHAEHFEAICRRLEGLASGTAADVPDVERTAEALAPESWTERQREAA